MKPLNLIALLAFLTGVVWVLTLSERTVRKIQKTYYSAISPFLKSGSEVELRANAFMKEVEHSEDLEKQIQRLNLEFGELVALKPQLRDLERENNELRSALEFKKRASMDVVAARIIRRQPASWWRTAIINRGTKHGIGPQLPVLANGGLAGKIDLPDETVSSMILLTDERCQVSVQVEGTPEVGILSGQRGKYGETPLLRLRHLSKKAPVEPGMKVITTGRGGLFPPNIVVGTVVKPTAGPVEGEATVKPSVDFENLSIVFVIAEASGSEAGSSDGKDKTNATDGDGKE